MYKKYGNEMQGLVDRLKGYWEICKSKYSHVKSIMSGTSQNQVIQLRKTHKVDKEVRKINQSSMFIWVILLYELKQAHDYYDC